MHFYQSSESSEFPPTLVLFYPISFHCFYTYALLAFLLHYRFLCSLGNTYILSYHVYTFVYWFALLSFASCTLRYPHHNLCVYSFCIGCWLANGLMPEYGYRFHWKDVNRQFTPPTPISRPPILPQLSLLLPCTVHVSFSSSPYNNFESFGS